MGERLIKFLVIVNDEVLARDMSLDTALTLAEGLFTKYYGDPDLKVTIAKEVTD